MNSCGESLCAVNRFAWIDYIGLSIQAYIQKITPCCRAMSAYTQRYNTNRGLTVFIPFPLDVAIRIGLRDAQDAVDAIRAWPLVGRIVRREHVLLLLHAVMLLIVGRSRWPVCDDRRRLRWHRAYRPAVASTAIMTSTAASMMAHRLGLLRCFVPHDSERETPKKKQNYVKNRTVSTWKVGILLKVYFWLKFT